MHNTFRFEMMKGRIFVLRIQGLPYSIETLQTDICEKRRDVKCLYEHISFQMLGVMAKTLNECHFQEFVMLLHT